MEGNAGLGSEGESFSERISDGDVNISEVILEVRDLQVKEGAPVLLLERRTYLTDGRPLEVVKSVYRGDRYKFIVEMERRK